MWPSSLDGWRQLPASCTTTAAAAAAVSAQHPHQRRSLPSPQLLHFKVRPLHYARLRNWTLVVAGQCWVKICSRELASNQPVYLYSQMPLLLLSKHSVNCDIWLFFLQRDAFICVSMWSALEVVLTVRQRHSSHIHSWHQQQHQYCSSSSCCFVLVLLYKFLFPFTNCSKTNKYYRK